jgi:S-(hydroxymethyl)glutathione dehydrogenase/alcohol dehydrogenase
MGCSTFSNCTVLPEIAVANIREDAPFDKVCYMDGKINIDDLITHRMPLAKINTAFDLMHSGESIRSVVVYS